MMPFSIGSLSSPGIESEGIHEIEVAVRAIWILLLPPLLSRARASCGPRSRHFRRIPESASFLRRPDDAGEQRHPARDEHQVQPARRTSYLIRDVHPVSPGIRANSVRRASHSRGGAGLETAAQFRQPGAGHQATRQFSLTILK